MEIKFQLLTLAIVLAVFLNCVSAAGKCKVCDGTDACKNNPGSITDSDCANANCFTLIDSSGNIKRGCDDSTINCDAKKNCKPCPASETACNTKTDLFYCKSCNSSNNPDCAYWKNENSIDPEICSDGVTKCITEIKDDKHTYRRCATKSDETCESGKKCETCTDKGCNKGIFPSNRRQCYQCNSDNEKCATPTKYTSDIKSFPCLLYNESDKCFEYGSSSTKMTRGCLSDTTDYEKCKAESPTEKCKECDTDSCNVDEFEVDKDFKCIICKSDDAKCVEAQAADNAKKCEKKIEYWKNPGCYTNKAEVGKVDRGCIQDFDCTTSSGSCTTCTTGTACNNAAQTGSQCYKCRSDENPKCSEALDKDSFKSQACRNSTTFNDGNLCYIERWNDIVIRSCLADADKITRKNCLDSNYKLCEICKGDNCNSGKVPNSAYGVTVASWLFAFSLFLVLMFH